ncbi:peptidase [Pantoea ananatis 15320]|nr:peptidase [Pantoea ananatis 15320]
MPVMSRASIRTLTKQLRTAFKIRGLYFPVMEVVEFALPQFLPEFEFHVLSRKEMGQTHGLTFPQESTIILREDVYIGASNGNGRDRMTVAHEIGHLLMHKNIAFARSEPDVKIAAFVSSEWQAKCFSGELLVPHHLASVWGEKSVEEIAKECGVSLVAAEYQKRCMKRP